MSVRVHDGAQRALAVDRQPTTAAAKAPAAKAKAQARGDGDRDGDFPRLLAASAQATAPAKRAPVEPETDAPRGKASKTATFGQIGDDDDEDDASLQVPVDALAALAAMLQARPPAPLPTSTPASGPLVTAGAPDDAVAAIGVRLADEGSNGAPSTTAPSDAPDGHESRDDAPALGESSLAPAVESATKAGSVREASPAPEASPANDALSLEVQPRAHLASDEPSAAPPRVPEADPAAIAQLLADAASRVAPPPEPPPADAPPPVAPVASVDEAADPAPVDGHLGAQRAELCVGWGEEAVSLRVSTSGARVRVEAVAATVEMARTLVEHRSELDGALGRAGLSLSSFSSHSDSDGDRGARQHQPRRDDTPEPPASTPLERSAHAHRRFA